MSKESKIVKIYVEDWEILNQMLGVLQAQQKKRLAFADVVHWILEMFVKKWSDEMSNWISRFYESLPQEAKDEIEKGMKEA